MADDTATTVVWLKGVDPEQRDKATEKAKALGFTSLQAWLRTKIAELANS